MTTHVLYALIPVLLSPALIAAALRRRRVSALIAAWAIAAAVLLLPLADAESWPVLVASLAGLLALHTLVLRRAGDSAAARSLLLLANLLVVTLIVGSAGRFGGFNPVATRVASDLASRNPLVAELTYERFHTLVLAAVGLILVTLEINHPIALLLRRRHLLPDPGSSTAGRDEAARGRVIGYLERSIVFVLVLAGRLEAVGLVLVAKGIARFRQLEDRDFAEYFLIGTLLSIAGAMLVGVAAAALADGVTGSVP